ncbi:hypothetical protein ACLQ18_29080, partial [Streptomyces sp. DT193]|uniref:hypothetical protein n=1 Tax=Streptomyces sp. DT193 TaxID=3393418 RepID=UPI003CEF7049
NGSTGNGSTGNGSTGNGSTGNGSTGNGSTGSTTLWRQPSFYWPVVLGPIIASICVTVLTGSFSKVVDFFTGGSSGVIASVERVKPSPRVSEGPGSDTAANQKNAPKDPRIEPQGLTPSQPSKQTGAAVIEAKNFNGDPCGHDSWVYFRPPDDFHKKSKIPFPTYSTAADADSSSASITVELSGDSPVQVIGVHLKVTKRSVAPKPNEATLVNFDYGMRCLFDPSADGAILATANMDGPGNLKKVTPLHGYRNRLPAVIDKGDFFTLEVDVSSSECSCSWVPVVEWKLHGERHTTEVTNTGAPFRITPSRGLKTVSFWPIYNDKEDLTGWFAD